MTQETVRSGRRVAATLSSLVRTLQKDACARWVVVYLGLASLPYVLPFFAHHQLERWQAGGFVILLPAVLAALQYRLREVSSRRERRFWHLLTFAHLSWWGAALLERLVAGEDLSTQFLVDALMVLFYVAPLLAGAQWPHRESAARSSTAALLERVEIIVMVLGFFAYFVLIPGWLEPRIYLTGLPSLVLFVALDLIVAIRFAQLARLCGSARWWTLYGLVALSFALWGGLDFLEACDAAGRFAALSGPRWMILWHLPLAVVVLAARRRHVDTQGHRQEKALEALSEDALPSSGSPLGLAALSLPAVHLGLSLLGFLSDETRPLRELATLLCLAILGSLAFLERRWADRETRRQTSFLSSLIESSPLATVLLDAEARVVTCNPAFESLFVYSRAELVGQKLEDCLNTEETRAEALDNVRAVLRGETIFRVTRRTRRDGSVVDVRLLGIPLVISGRLVGAFGLYQDIGPQRRAERQLRDSEERFRRLAEATFEGILISVGGRVVDANEQAARIFGYPLSELVGATLGTRVAPESKALVLERTRRGYGRPYEIDAFQKDGSRIRLEVRGQEVPYRGELARVTVLRDVTARRRLEDQLRQSQKMEAIGRLATGIAHDFNNLLTVILGRSMLLLDQFEPGSQPRQDVEEICQAAERASLVTGQLLTFGRRQGREPEVLDLNLLVAGMEKMLGRLLREDIELSVTAAEPVLVEADPVQLEQVLLNLAINAQDAMPDGGRLTIAVTATAGDGLREALGLAPGDYVGLEVRDTGVGMDAGVRSRVFEPFFTTKDKGEGTGLGLAMVYGIVQQAGGGITLDSSPGHGTVFEILLPRSERELAPAEAAWQAATPARGAHTVLVVEDVKEVCMFVGEVLRLSGYHALTAELPRQALETLESYQGEIDLLLTDVTMPQMNGFELADKVREVRPDIKVLYMSGYTDVTTLRRRYQRSEMTLLRKPFNHEDLIGKVAEVLGLQG